MVRSALATVVALALLVGCSGADDDVARARGILRDRERFATAVEAGEALAEVSDLLLADAEACDEDCDAGFRSAAYARVLALRVLGCTAPGREEARTTMLEHVDALQDGSSEPPTPAVPDCPSPR